MGALNVGTDLSVSGSLTTNDAVTLLANARTGAGTHLHQRVRRSDPDHHGDAHGRAELRRRRGRRRRGSFRGIFPPLAGVTFDQLNDDFQTQGAEGSDFPDAQPNLYTL